MSNTKCAAARHGLLYLFQDFASLSELSVDMAWVRRYGPTAALRSRETRSSALESLMGMEEPGLVSKPGLRTRNLLKAA